MPDCYQVCKKLDDLAEKYPGCVIDHRQWYQADKGEMHHILQFRCGSEEFSAVGTTLEMAYCELRRKMTTGE